MDYIRPKLLLSLSACKIWYVCKKHTKYKNIYIANLHLNVFFVASLTADTSLEERSIVIHIIKRAAVRSDAFFILIQRGSFKVIYRVNTVEGRRGGNLVALDTVLSLREFVSRLSFYCVHKIADLL